MSLFQFWKNGQKYQNHCLKHVLSQTQKLPTQSYCNIVLSIYMKMLTSSWALKSSSVTCQLYQESWRLFTISEPQQNTFRYNFLCNYTHSRDMSESVIFSNLNLVSIEFGLSVDGVILDLGFSICTKVSVMKGSQTRRKGNVWEKAVG